MNTGKHGFFLRICLPALAAALLMSASAQAEGGFFDFEEQTEPNLSDLSKAITLTINNKEEAWEQLEQMKPLLDGEQVTLHVSGSGAGYLPFLTGCAFTGLELNLTDKFGDLYYSDEETTVRASDIPNLTSLSYGEDRNHDQSEMGTFSSLEHLTVRIEGWGTSYFGRMGSDRLPVLKTLRIDFADEYVQKQPSLPHGMILPETLEEIEVYCAGELIPADGIWNQNLLGAFAVCCPQAAVNGMPLEELLEQALHPVSEEGEETDLTDEFESASANTMVYGLYQKAKTDAAPWSAETPNYDEGLLFATIEDDAVGKTSLEALQNGEDFYQVPKEALAASAEEAKTVVIIEEQLTLVGYYYMGNAYRTTTNLILMNAGSGEIYAKDTIAVNEPPETIETTTINGAAVAQSGYGEFEVQTAVDRILSRIGSGDGASQQSDGHSSAASVPEDLVMQILDALENDTYRSVREFLKSGETIGSGYRGDPGAGLQQMFADFGCEISVDGAVGQQTIGALQQIQDNFSLPQTETVGLEEYDQLLPLLLMTQDEEKAEELLPDYYEEAGGPGYYAYLKGCAFLLRGRYYAAKEAFAQSGYGDSTAKAQSCEQPWPENGEIWRSSEVPGSDVGLTFTVNSYDESLGRCFHMYTLSGKLTAVLFVTGSGSATTYVPSGTYRIKDGSGHAWYGKTDAFGRDGYYEFMSFNEEDTENMYDVQLNPGSYELTVNVSEVNEDAEGVGASTTDWDNWV